MKKINFLNLSKIFSLFTFTTTAFAQEETKTTIKHSTPENIETYNKDGRRPIPICTDAGKTYDDLIFYEYDTNKKSDKIQHQLFDALPPKKPLLTHKDLISAKLEVSNYTQIEEVCVCDMPFNKALKANITNISKNPHESQIVLKNINRGVDYNENDSMLLLFYLKTVSAKNEALQGKIHCIANQTEAPYLKVLQEDVIFAEGDTWHKVYLPFIAKTEALKISISLGYEIQNIEIGGFELINYGSDIKTKDLPYICSMNKLDKSIFYNRDEIWRKEAFDRIENIRRGDINVIVKDSSGNIVPDAKVSVDMFEHEFQWGTALNDNILDIEPKNENYIKAARMFFNTAVLENDHKWVVYEKNPNRARVMLDRIKSLNIREVRGHALIWDRDYLSKPWSENTTVPSDLVELTKTDKKAMDNRIKNHFSEICTDFKGEIFEWDVVNELANNNAIRTKYGNEVLIDWYNWAREAVGDDVELYINETGIVGRENDLLSKFIPVVDFMSENNVDFDGIGVQAHFGEFVHPMDFNAQLDKLSKYGKRLKITEYDYGYNVSEIEIKDGYEVEASFMRDIIITVFSRDDVDGFLMWGFWDDSHWLENSPLFDKNWNLKPSGKQFLDLVYNKWWTNETGVTNSDGKMCVKGYYGDYDITASYNGQSKTVSAKCYKGNENTITITLD